MSVENMGNGYVKVGVKQEDLEASIAGLRQLKPILQAQVTRGNGNNTRQAAIDRAEIGKHFDTAINAMLILYSAFEASEMTEEEITKWFEAMEREAKKEIDTGADKTAFMCGISRTAAGMAGKNPKYARFIKDCLYIKRSGILQGRLCDFGFRALRNRRNKRKPPYVARQIGGGSGI